MDSCYTNHKCIVFKWPSYIIHFGPKPFCHVQKSNFARPQF
ncbi:hypothetical protein PITC_013250 [Penicillium italicum]|uniref:Uncharacterized protein n=1 Tax=Penicillium italicum TaxID=40296 RepID=A0A0A2K7Y1_PENIT|nr:hypothetical protein PITC_013250 [Penicillium italicum]